MHLGYPKLARWACRWRFWCELVHLQRLIFALSLETNLRASVELCRLRTWSVEPRDFGRPSSALDEVSPTSAVGEEADLVRVVRSTVPINVRSPRVQSGKSGIGVTKRLLQHGVIPRSSQTRATESALQERRRPASCGLARIERRWPVRPIDRDCNTEPPASPYAIMRRAYPCRGENSGPGKDIVGKLDTRTRN